ncbi:MAG: DUF4627 domain-containing protein [Prevotella sp.]|nr:DUF4627 domain-containing protein [Prevotella sp.]
MKRTSLLFGILLFAAGTFAQSGVTNKEFVTDGNLAASTIDPAVQTASWAGKGVWASRFGSWKDATISVVADTERGHAIKASYTKTNNDYDNGPYIYQRLKDQPGAGKATVGFWAKSPVANAVVGASLRLWQFGTYEFRVRQAFKLDDYSNPVTAADSTRSGAVKEFKLTDSWAYYTVVIDLTQIVNELGYPKWAVSQGRNYYFVDANDNDRKEMYVCFQGLRTVGEVYIAGVSVIAPESVATSISRQPSAKFSVNIVDRDILISGLSQPVRLYNMEGILIGEDSAAGNGSVVFTVPSGGVYIVKSGKTSKSIRVK